MHVNGASFPIPSEQTEPSSPAPNHFGVKNSLIEEQAEPIDLEGVVDLTNTVDTTVHERVEPGTYNASLSRRRSRSKELSRLKLNPLLPDSPTSPSFVRPENWPFGTTGYTLGNSKS